MNYEFLDDEELLGISLDAINGSRDEDAVVLLKVLLNRNPVHALGQYLLAAQHAQLGLFERAEGEFRRAVELRQDLPWPASSLGGCCW